MLCHSGVHLRCFVSTRLHLLRLCGLGGCPIDFGRIEVQRLNCLAEGTAAFVPTVVTISGFIRCCRGQGEEDVGFIVCADSRYL